MTMEKRFELKMDKAFFEVAKRDYADARGITMAEAIRSALEDAMSMAGVEWKHEVQADDLSCVLDR